MGNILGKKGKIGLVWFLLIGCVYSVSVFRIPINYADSDDLTLAAYYGGLAHPPGYPLLIFLTHFWLKEVPSYQVATAANLFNAWVSAGVVVLIFFTAYELFWGYRKYLGLTSEKATIGYALVSSFCFAMWQTTWFNARVLEVFPLGQLLTLLTILLALIIKFNKQPIKPAVIFLLGFTFLTAITYHPLTLLAVGPALIFGASKIIKTKLFWKWVILGLICSIFMTAGLYHFGVNPRAAYSWPGETNFEGMVKWITRAAYTPEGSAIELDAKRFNLKQSLLSILILGKLWLFETFGLGFVLALIGFWQAWLKIRPVAWWLGGTFFLCALVLVFYLKFPLKNLSNEMSYWSGLYLRWRMQFVAAIPLALLMGMGWVAVGQRLRAKSRTAVVSLCLIFMAVGSVFCQGQRYSPQILQMMQEHSQATLNSLPLGATLLADNDNVFNFLYEQKILGIRSDLTIRPLRFSVSPEDETPISLPFEKMTIEDAPIEKIVSVLSQQEDVFLYAPSVSLISFLGIEGDPFYAVPYGYTLRVGRKMPEANLQFDYRNSQNYIAVKKLYKPWFISNLGSQLGYIHTKLMYVWERLGYTQAARAHMELAMELSQNLKTKEDIEKSKEQARWVFLNHGTYAEYKSPTPKDFLDRLQQMENLDLKTVQYLISRAILIDPTNKQLHQLLPH